MRGINCITQSGGVGCRGLCIPPCRRRVSAELVGFVPELFQFRTRPQPGLGAKPLVGEGVGGVGGPRRVLSETATF